MKKYAVTSALTLFLAVPAIASASSPYSRYCGTQQDGALVGPSNSNGETRFEVHGPWHISMTKAEAIRLTQRFPVQEFGGHLPASAMPCTAASAIAISGGNAWANGSGNGWVNVVAYSSGGDAHLGRFHCSGYSIDNGKAVAETCSQRDRDGHLVVGKFDITPNPHY